MGIISYWLIYKEQRVDVFRIKFHVNEYVHPFRETEPTGYLRSIAEFGFTYHPFKKPVIFHSSKIQNLK